MTAPQLPPHGPPQWPSIDPPAEETKPDRTARFVKFFRTTNPVTIVIVILAIVVPIFALWGILTTSHSSPSGSSTSSSSSEQFPLTSQQQRLVSVFNQHSGDFAPGTEMMGDEDGTLHGYLVMSLIYVNGRNGNFSNQRLASMLSELGFPSSVYNNITTHHYTSTYERSDTIDAYTSDYKLSADWYPEENANALVLSINARCFYFGYPKLSCDNQEPTR